MFQGNNRPIGSTRVLNWVILIIPFRLVGRNAIVPNQMVSKEAGGWAVG